MANEFVARKGIISSGSLTIAPLAGNTDEIVSLTAAGTLQASGLTSASIASDITAAAGTFDLDFSADSGTNGSVDNSQTFAIVGGNGISTTANGNQQLTIAGVAGLVSGSEQIEDVVGGMLTGNTETNITVTYQDTDGTIDFSVPNASATAKGVIEIATNAEVTTGTDTSRAITPSSLTSITKLGTVTTGNVTGILPSGTVSGSAQIAINSTAGTLAVNKGGTGQTTYTDGQILIGNSTGNTLAKQTLSGDVTMTNAGVVTIGNDKVTYAKIQNVAANNVLLGNDNGTNQGVQELTKANVLSLLNVEDGADVTDATNVKANLPANTVSSSAQLIATAAGQVATANIADDAVTYDKIQNVAANNVLLGNDNGAGNGIQELTKANVLSLLNVEDGADVTDATNVKDNLPAGVVSGSITSPNQGEISVNGVTVDLGLQTNDSPTFSGLSVTNDVTITGDLTVLGAAVELQVSELNVEDKTITVASGSTDNAAADNAGIVIDRGTDGTAQFKWDSTTTSFQLSHDLGLPEKIVHTGDTDTYFSFPATNRAAIYAGGNLGVYVDGQGDVGIGTDGGGNLNGAKLTVAGNISGSGKLFLGTADSNTTSTAALVLNGTEVEQRALGTGAFVDVGNSATQDTGSMRVLIADSAVVATNASNIDVDEKNDNVNYQVLFSTANGTGYQRPYIDTDNAHLTYNPSTHTLTAGTFSGNLSGNATTATTATNSSQLGGVTALGYVTTGSAAQDIAGVKTFTGGIEVETDGTNSTISLTSDYTATINDSTTADIHTVTPGKNITIFYDYRLEGESGQTRGGTVIASYDSNTPEVTFTEFSSGDAGGDTSGVVLNVIQASGVVKLQATNNSGSPFTANVFARTV